METLNTPPVPQETPAPDVPPIQTDAPVPPVPVIPPEPTPAPAPEIPVPPVATQEASTGIPFYDNAASMLTAAGLDPGDVFKQVTDAGDTISDETRKQLTDKLGASQAYMLEQGFTQQKTSERVERDAVFNAVGGKDTWDAIVQWTHSEASTIASEDAATYNSMLAQGGKQANLAVEKIKEAYMADPNTNVPANNMMQGDGVPPVGTVVEPISRSIYVEQKNKAIRENDAATVAKLEQRARYTMDKQPTLWRPAKAMY